MCSVRLHLISCTLIERVQRNLTRNHKHRNPLNSIEILQKPSNTIFNRNQKIRKRSLRRGRGV